MRCGHGVQEGAAAVRAEAEATRGLEGVFKVAPSSIESRWSQSRYASEHAVLLTTQVELVKPDALRLDRRVNFLVRKEQLLKRPEEQAERAMERATGEEGKGRERASGTGYNCHHCHDGE